MATNRKRTPRSRKDASLTGAQEIYLFRKTDLHVNPFEQLDLNPECNSLDLSTKAVKNLKAVWPTVRDRVLTSWIKEHPCTRPVIWWSFEAPESRMMLSGKITIFPTDYPEKRSYSLGLPTHYNADLDDPPIFESEAAYLQRHELLTAAEKMFLKDHPELLEPVKV